MKVVAQDLAGNGYRYVRFDLRTGDIWLRHGQSLATDFTGLKGVAG